MQILPSLGGGIILFCFTAQPPQKEKEARMDALLRAGYKDGFDRKTVSKKQKHVQKKVHRFPNGTTRRERRRPTQDCSWCGTKSETWRCGGCRQRFCKQCHVAECATCHETYRGTCIQACVFEECDGCDELICFKCCHSERNDPHHMRLAPPQLCADCKDG